MTGHKSIKVVGGSSEFPESEFCAKPEHRLEAFNILRKYDVPNIDTARAYNRLEEILGSIKDSSGFEFTFDTKWPGDYAQIEGWNMRDLMMATAEASLQKLRVSNADIFHLHAPDYRATYEELLNGVNDSLGADLFND